MAKTKVHRRKAKSVNQLFLFDLIVIADHLAPSIIVRFDYSNSSSDYLASSCRISVDALNMTIFSVGCPDHLYSISVALK